MGCRAMIGVMGSGIARPRMLSWGPVAEERVPAAPLQRRQATVHAPDTTVSAEPASRFHAAAEGLATKRVSR